MFDEKLANKILEILEREYPDTVTVARLQEALPEFSTLSRDDWYRAIIALRKAGFVGGPILPSGINQQIDDIGPMIITEKGRRISMAASESSKRGLFISHIADEKAFAQALKDFFRATFGPDLKIFVSSDYESIQSGAQWFTSIVDALRSAEIVLVLLSETSVEKRWINFEAGVGIGAQARVIPVVHRKLDKGNIGLPLSQLQARNLHDPNDVRGLVSDIGRASGLEVKSLDANRVVSDLLRIEGELPRTRAMLTPYLSRQPFSLRFRLENTGSQEIEPLMVEASVPKRYLDPNWHPMSDPNVFEIKQTVTDAEPYLFLGYRAFQGPTNPNFGPIERLPQIISVGMPPYELKPPFAFALRPDLKEADGVDVPIFYATHAKGVRPERAETTYRKLVMQNYSK